MFRQLDSTMCGACLGPGCGELPGVPDRGGHGISAEDLVEEMTSDGFEVVERYDDWNGNDNRYCVVFRRADEPGATGASR
jgi:hypothetical protein